MQLRTLTLGDVFEVNKPVVPVQTTTATAQNPQPGLSSTTTPAHNPGLAVHIPAAEANNPAVAPLIPAASTQQADAEATVTKIGLHFRASTSVQAALEALTGPAAPAAPFTVAQLMAAFGAALQREEDAWKR